MDLGILERFILDPVSEGGTETLEVSGGMVPDGEAHGFGLMEIAFPRPEVQRNWAGSRNTEGERPSGDPRYMNRKIPVKVWGWEAQGVGQASNLVTNPSFEIDTAGWATSGGALTAGGTLTRVLGGYAGEYSGNLVAAAANHGLGINATLAVSTAYKLRFGARKISGSVASLTVARAATGLGSVTLSDQWQMFEIDVPSTTAGAHLFSMRANAAGTFQIDAVSIQASTVETKYFDGDTPGCSWTGTAHASTSDRRGTGSDLKRFLDCIFELETKLEKLARSGGTCKRYMGDGTPIAFDVLDATYPADWQRTINQGRMEFNFELTCKPFGRRARVDLGTVTKASATSLAAVDTGVVAGNAPALVRLKVTDTGSAQRNHLLVGAAQRTDPFQLLAKTRQLLGGALANSPTTAATTNGGATNGTVKMTMTGAWRPILSTNDSAPAYQTHEGPQRILARMFFPATNTADAYLKFEWAQADLTRWGTSDLIDGSAFLTVSADSQNGVWRWVDFGIINLRKPRSDVFNDTAGWRWEGRITSKGASGDVYVDTIAVVPAGQFIAECFSNPQIPEPNEALIGQGFATSTGNLAGTAALVGGNWSEIGGTTQYKYGTGVYRTGSTEAAPKFERLGASTQSGILVAGRLNRDTYYAAEPVIEQRGFLLRYVDTSNYVFVGKSFTASGGTVLEGIFVKAVKAGSTVLSMTAASPSVNWPLLVASITTAGDGFVCLYDEDGNMRSLLFWPANADLATGGTLASGGFGLAHRVVSGTNVTGNWSTVEFRSLTNAIVQDAVVFPGRSAILTHDNALRYDSAGNSLGEIGRYQGDRLTVPAGAQSRIVILDHRTFPGAPDNNLDPFTADVSLIPRVIDVPEPV